MKSHPVHHERVAQMSQEQEPKDGQVWTPAYGGVNDRGGRQSKVIHAMDEIPPDVLLKVAAVLHAGREKYGAGNWKRIAQRDHLNHAMVHIVKFMAGDRSESHLVNAICRLMFAEAVGSEDTTKGGE